MKKNKLTRRSFKRKVVTFGLTVFMSIALIATGFAAWVMSTNAESSVEGDGNVGFVTGGSLSLSGVGFADGSAKGFYFEPREDDTTGRVKYDGTNKESLSITVSGTVSPLEELGKFYYKIKIPKGVKDAADKGYIVLPAGATTDVTATEGDDNFVEGVEIAKNGTTGASNFSFTVEFTWGAKFGEANPGVYYDETEAGKKVSHLEVKKTLEDFRAVLFGYMDELTTAEETAATEAENAFNEANQSYPTEDTKAQALAKVCAEAREKARADVIATHAEKVEKGEEALSFTVYVYAESGY